MKFIKKSLLFLLLFCVVALLLKILVAFIDDYVVASYDIYCQKKIERIVLDNITWEKIQAELSREGFKVVVINNSSSMERYFRCSWVTRMSRWTETDCLPPLFNKPVSVLLVVDNMSGNVSALVE